MEGNRISASSRLILGHPSFSRIPQRLEAIEHHLQPASAATQPTGCPRPHARGCGRSAIHVSARRAGVDPQEVQGLPASPPCGVALQQSVQDTGVDQVTVDAGNPSAAKIESDSAAFGSDAMVSAALRSFVAVAEILPIRADRDGRGGGHSDLPCDGPPEAITCLSHGQRFVDLEDVF